MDADDPETASLTRAAGTWLAEHVPAPPDDLGWSERLDGGVRVFAIAPPRASGVPIAMFALMWDGFLAFWYALALRAGSGVGVLMLVFPLIHVFAGFVVTREALRRLLNRAIVRVGAGRLAYAEGPIPNGPRIEVPLDAIESVTIGEASQRWRSNFGNDRTQIAVRLVTKEPRTIELGLRLPSEVHARFVAQRIEHALEQARAPHGYRG